MRFAVLGYREEPGRDARLGASRAALEEGAAAFDDELRRSGRLLAGVSLRHRRDAVALRRLDGRLEVGVGAPGEGGGELDGLRVVEARDLNHAIQLLSLHPGIGLGSFAVLPVDDRGGREASGPLRSDGRRFKDGFMREEPSERHRWLDRLVGSWSVSSEGRMVPGEPPMIATGVEVVRSVGGLWVVAEGIGEMPGAGPSETIMTLGFDARAGRYVGTFVASAMTHLWISGGELDAAGRVLCLDNEGPSLDGTGTSRYRDVITILSEDERVMTSHHRTGEGSWDPLLTMRYRRIA
ncbi:DUF1579 domain-containing protein [Tautonia sociabilis]|uniref:DUF1579 domain-containing protein n=1 Tax=Tautonia sociabilis TaxID=2080755 RepID=A0A432MIB8_9BACT|nr:DUF1579 family protein [Tautonia sociabilis]RUL87103.1 DUF1579 domain-containing protein [Tautonia sociabilis]